MPQRIISTNPKENIMKKIITAAMLGTFLLAQPAFAEEEMTRKAQWESMSDAEKVKFIEEKRSERIQEMNKKWNNMSDAEKIKFAEERRKKGKKMEHMREKRQERRSTE